MLDVHIAHAPTVSFSDGEREAAYRALITARDRYRSWANDAGERGRTIQQRYYLELAGHLDAVLGKLGFANEDEESETCLSN